MNALYEVIEINSGGLGAPKLTTKESLREVKERLNEESKEIKGKTWKERKRPPRHVGTVDP